MPIDFSKLRDPQWQAEFKAKDAERAAAVELKDAQLRAALDTCLAAYDSLSDSERRFIRSAQHALNTWQLLSPPRERWLHDIAARFKDSSQPPAQS